MGRLGSDTKNVSAYISKDIIANFNYSTGPSQGISIDGWQQLALSKIDGWQQ